MSDDASALQRLRAAGLRPTTARIGILQVIHAAGVRGIGADEVFRQMLLRGVHVSTSTVYRIIHELDSLGVLLHDRTDHRYTVYRLAPPALPLHEVRVACRQCERFVVLPGAALRSELQSRAAHMGLSPLLEELVLQVQCLGRESGCESSAVSGCGTQG
ncbi:MAG: Fur family transcriptional regulator [Acidovorax sp.]|uniref:Fur family transcriptional regulator n=1 Tax=Acidovorax sp. TaxID=1872122 RepID=UPI003919DD45